MRNENQIEGSDERGIPGATARKKTRVGKFLSFAIILVILAAIVGFGIVTVNRFTALKLKEKAEQRKARDDKLAASQTGPQGDLSSQMSRIKKDEQEKASEAAAASAAAVSTLPTPASAMTPNNSGNIYPAGAQASSAVVPGMSPADAEKRRIEDRQQSGDVSLFSSSDAKASGPSNGVAETLAAIKASAQNNAVPPAAAPGKLNSLEDQLTPSNIAAGQASLLPDLDYLLQRGTTIRCGVITRVVSTWPGAVTCRVLEDVYSANGHTLLVRAGAQAFGEQRNALAQGQARIFVLWDEIDDGKVKITVNSPAADSLGGSGMEAYVDNHFWLRFGGAMMVSVISDFGQALANKSLGGGSSTVTFSGTSNTADSAAEEALKSTIDIPPTAYTNQGAVTNIFVARHIDMSNVYKVIKDE